MKTTEKKEKKEKPSKISLIFLGISFIAFITYTIIEIINYTTFKAFLPKLLGIVFILSFLICFIIISLKNTNRKASIIIGCILVTIYSIINILLSLNIISLPHDEYVPNFYNQSILEVDSWYKENNIDVVKLYEYSDTIKKYHVISQDTLYPTLTKDINTITITISLGPDLNKEIIVPNFIGLSIDDVISFAEKNYLSNISINYQISEDSIDKVISQSKSGTLKRNDNIIVTLGKSEETGDINIIDLTNKSKLYALAWLNKYNFKVEINEEYSDKVTEGYVIKQNYVNEIKNPNDDVITLTISKGKMILAPDITSMSQEEINEWVLNNNLKITYKEAYSDEVFAGDIISANVKENDVINNSDIEVIISKGALKMIKYINLNNFINWAEENNVSYDIKYEASAIVKKDSLISSSHKEGQVIKKDDTVILTISSGKNITIPNFINMNKTNIQNKCKELNLTCSFKYGGYTENKAKDIAINQSKKTGTIVSEGTNLTITLSSGIYVKVNVPNFVGQAKNNIQTQCNNIGIVCKFTYQAGYNSTPKDHALKQSKTGTVNKGSTITITLSNGPAITYNITIDANQLSSGNPNATKATLEAKLKNACPGVTFIFRFEKANSGIGYLSPNSDVKVGNNQLMQGETYNVIINSN